MLRFHRGRNCLRLPHIMRKQSMDKGIFFFKNMSFSPRSEDVAPLKLPLLHSSLHLIDLSRNIQKLHCTYLFHFPISPFFYSSCTSYIQTFSPVTPLEVRNLTGNYLRLLHQVQIVAKIIFFLNYVQSGV